MQSALSIAVVAVSLQAGCTEEPPPPEAPEQANARYERLNDEFDDASQCPTTGLPNCYAQFELCINGGFRLILEDIVEEGNWVHDGAGIAATAQSYSTWSFALTIAADGTMTSDDIGGVHPWVKVPLDQNEDAQLVMACDTLEGRNWW